MIVDHFSAGSEQAATVAYSKNEEQQSEYQELAGLARDHDSRGPLGDGGRGLLKEVRASDRAQGTVSPWGHLQRLGRQ